MTNPQIALPLPADPTPGTGRVTTSGPARDGEVAAGPGHRPRVIGLDLSIAATGVADNQHGPIETATIRTDPKDYGKTHDEQWRRLAKIRDTIAKHLALGRRPALVVIEGPSYGSKGNALHQIAGLWWMVYDHLNLLDTPHAIITPGELKKYATGKGSADKPDMRVALLTRAGIDQRDNNRVDAHWLAAAALEHLGHTAVPVPKAQRDALAKVAWPEVNGRG